MSLGLDFESQVVDRPTAVRAGLELFWARHPVPVPNDQCEDLQIDGTGVRSICRVNELLLMIPESWNDVEYRDDPGPDSDFGSDSGCESGCGIGAARLGGFEHLAGSIDRRVADEVGIGIGSVALVLVQELDRHIDS